MQYDKIVVIQTAFIGDVILVTPLLEILANGLTKAKLTEACLVVVTTPQGKEILAGNPAISEIIIYDKKDKARGLLKFFELVEKIKREGFDLAVIPHRSLRSSLLAYLAKIPQRVGFNTSAGAFLFTTKIPYQRDKHEVERNLDLALLEPGTKTEACLAVERKLRLERGKPPSLKIYLAEEEKVFAQRFLEECGVANDFLVGFAPGSVWATKRWMTSGYAQVGDELSNTYGAKVIIFGSKDDTGIAEQIRRSMKTSTRQVSPIIAAGKTNLKELSALIARCNLFVSNDTAPLHIAMAFNIPTVAIFGPTTLDIGFGPYGENFVVVERKGLKCRPCSLHGPRQCPKKHFACMNKISPQEVILACQKLKV